MAYCAVVVDCVVLTAERIVYLGMENDVCVPGEDKALTAAAASVDPDNHASRHCFGSQLSCFGWSFVIFSVEQCHDRKALV